MSTRLQIENRNNEEGNTIDLVATLRIPRKDLLAVPTFMREEIVRLIQDPRRSNAAILHYLADFVAVLDGAEAPEDEEPRRMIDLG